jgi:chromosome segregation ATPase
MSIIELLGGTMKIPVLAATVVTISFAAICMAQTKSPKAVPPTKLAQCQAENTALRSYENEWSSRYYAMVAEHDALVAQNAELTKKMDEIKSAAAELLKADQIVYPAAAKLQNDYGALVDKYNRLLDLARSQNDQLQAANAAVDRSNSRQQRVNNALAIYSAMPKYQPPQTLNLQVTNCNALPALCVH